MLLGAHISIQKGLEFAAERIYKLGGNVLQIFSSSPRNWKLSKFKEEDFEKFKEAKLRFGIKKVFVHAKYLVNIVSKVERVRSLSYKSLIYDLGFAEKIGAEGVIFHPHISHGKDKVVEVIQSLLKEFKGRAKLILEVSAQDNLLDYVYVFEKLKDSRLKFCIDIAHIFQSGIDLNNPVKLKDFFDSLVQGFKDKLIVIHSNDSKTKLGSRHDIHQNIGEGEISKEAFFALLNHPLTENLPFILETPGFKEKEGKSDRKNIGVLKKLKGKRLDREFFLKDAVWVAKNLLGKYLVVKKKGKLFAGRIVETEAYIGPEDKASHAFSNRRTKRTEIMFDLGGKLYVYLIYGMYHCLNFVIGKKDFPAAVLIRGVRPVVAGRKILDGPGKVCQSFLINKEYNGKDAVLSNEIFVVDIGEKPKKVVSAPRVGVDYADEWARKNLRFIEKL